jgi:hypothetical protein
MKFSYARLFAPIDAVRASVRDESDACDNPTHYRTLWISDLHLGRRVARPRRCSTS